MRKLGEQWVETLKDGTRHMFKLVEEYGFGYRWVYRKTGNGVEADLDVGSSCSNSDPKVISFKDLGILNEDGCLPNCWGEYPSIEELVDVHTKEHWFRCITRNNVYCATDSYKTKQETIDAWNRRV
jgi:hypothetical protein